jgi:hypothetical protein
LILLVAINAGEWAGAAWGYGLMFLIPIWLIGLGVVGVMAFVDRLTRSGRGAAAARTYWRCPYCSSEMPPGLSRCKECHTARPPAAESTPPS